jgi:glycosyltransferase A (GT-A) superfamily protein (DUF2064 family)
MLGRAAGREADGHEPALDWCPVTGTMVTALAAGLGVTGALNYARLMRLRAADAAVTVASAAVMPLVAWRAPGEFGWALAGALGVAALVPALGGDAATRMRRAAAGAFGVAWLAALML